MWSKLLSMDFEWLPQNKTKQNKVRKRRERKEENEHDPAEAWVI